VVLTDDHPSVLAAIERMLRPSCDIVASVSTGVEAVEAVSRLRPDVLVVDLMLSDLNGLEVSRRAKRVAPETGIVIVTAFDDPQIRTVALQDGVSAFVPKHSAARALKPAIQRIVAEKGRRSSASGIPRSSP
jgi:DNA-binding NarL/FixJ family response regulator